MIKSNQISNSLLWSIFGNTSKNGSSYKFKIVSIILLFCFERKWKTRNFKAKKKLSTCNKYCYFFLSSTDNETSPGGARAVGNPSESSRLWKRRASVFPRAADRGVQLKIN